MEDSTQDITQARFAENQVAQLQFLEALVTKGTNEQSCQAKYERISQ